MHINPHQTSASWSAFWRSGNGASCTEGSTASCVFDRAWKHFFQDLPPHSRILDLAAGNGFVAHLAFMVSATREAHFDIIGVDAAEIEADCRSTGASALAPCVFGGVRIESLPYRVNSFDAVVSHFGFEYANQLRAIRELSRVLKPGGAVRLVLHASEGAIFSSVRNRVDRIRRLTRPRGLVGLVRDGLDYAASGDAFGERLTDGLIESEIVHLSSLRVSPPPDDAALFYADGVTQLWRHRRRYTFDQLRASLTDACERVESLLMRQESLLLAAHSLQSIQVLTTLAGQCDLATETPSAVVDQHGDQIAWLVQGKKPIADT